MMSHIVPRVTKVCEPRWIGVAAAAAAAVATNHAERVKMRGTPFGTNKPSAMSPSGCHSGIASGLGSRRDSGWYIPGSTSPRRDSGGWVTLPFADHAGAHLADLGGGDRISDASEGVPSAALRGLGAWVVDSVGMPCEGPAHAGGWRASHINAQFCVCASYAEVLTPILLFL